MLRLRRRMELMIEKGMREASRGPVIVCFLPWVVVTWIVIL